MKESIPDLLLTTHLAATLFMTGVIWFVQVVHYPLFSMMGRSEFSKYEERHAALTNWIVGPPMLVELATALLLFWIRPADVSTWNLSIGLALLIVIWLSTALVQVPCHNALKRGFDAAAHRRLVWTNWVRTAGWSLRGLLVCWMAYG
jgi:hypothetical protein